MSLPHTLDPSNQENHTLGMKVAVSIPDPVFNEAELLVRQLGTTRSELYARALGAFVAQHAPDRVTEAMNRVIDEVGSEPDPLIVRAGARQVLKYTEW